MSAKSYSMLNTNYKPPKLLVYVEATEEMVAEFEFYNRHILFKEVKSKDEP